MTARFLPQALSAAIIGGLVFAAPANAEIQRVLQLDVQYDASALGTATGAESILISLQDQAETACRYTLPVRGTPRVDQACVTDIVAQAVAQIDDPELTRALDARLTKSTRMLAALK